MKLLLPKHFIMLIMFLSIAAISQSQTQVGANINGEDDYDQSGFSVSMPDANTVAIGAPYNGGLAPTAGHARIFIWNGNTWEQKGADIDAEAQQDFFGWSVSMPDANTIAVGAPHNQAMGTTSGHVRIFEWNGNNWVQKGIDIDAEGQYDLCGQSVSMPDANTVGIGSPWNFGSGIFAGQARIFIWDGNAWVQKGADMNAESGSDSFGFSVSMPNANTVAIGGPFNNEKGHVRIFDWDNEEWVQRGVDIDGEAIDDDFGKSVSMSDPNTVAIGAPRNDEAGENAGYVKVYEWNGTTWEQKGQNLNGEAADDEMGTSVSMADANTLAIGAPYNDSASNNSGQVRVYSWDGTSWIQVESAIGGSFQLDRSGSSVSMGDLNTVAVGAPKNGGLGFDKGQVRVFTYLSTSVIESSLSKISAYPNPTNDLLNVNLGELVSDLNIRVVNALGQEISYEDYGARDNIRIRFDGASGLYFVSINSGSKQLARLKVLKK